MSDSSRAAKEVTLLPTWISSSRPSLYAASVSPCSYPPHRIRKKARESPADLKNK